MTAPTLLTEAEAAQALRVCSRTLRKARKDGRLAYVLIGRAVRYTHGDLERFIESLRQQDDPMSKHQRPTVRRNQPAGKIVPFSQRFGQ